MLLGGNSTLRCAGMVEIVGVAVMVGLAVDYVVHMSAGVAHSGAAGVDAVAAALRNVGMSVVSGAVTTIGAAVFLLPCEMAVFQQFGAPCSCAAPRLCCSMMVVHWCSGSCWLANTV